MKEQMKRTVYEAPETKLFRIEMESGFCSGSADVENPKGNQGEIENQTINTGFDIDSGNDGFADGSWE